MSRRNINQVTKALEAAKTDAEVSRIVDEMPYDQAFKYILRHNLEWKLTNIIREANKKNA